ncbi:MAG: 2-amino-4-hydroxy-6-hydroxymethyldihydropteridine diphosphokinase [Lentisphaeria bacterium]|nr:2-amino-4-hydroxy-6-hydroxymethyldihydropteridine diphosphokinase [Lentisphaeria bacterium]
MKRKIFLALGGNIGDVPSVFDRALKYLSDNGVSILKRSSCAVTTPEDCPPGTPDFYNSAVLAETELEAEDLLKLTQKTEVLCGRPADHGFHESRTLDIDIIYMEDVRYYTGHLQIPHPRAAARDFVMRFLLELDADAYSKVQPLKMLTPCPGPMEGVMTPALIKTAVEEKVCSEFVTPFLRISEHIPKEKEIRKFLEPYKNNRVTLQLMGNSPSLLAESAAMAMKFDIAGINLNFGCPSGQVLRHQSGGAMLKNPPLMREICRAIRNRCPELVLSAKIRMGFDSEKECENWLGDWSSSNDDAPDFFILHSRSVSENYQPLPESEHISRSKKVVKLVSQPVMLNGDIGDVKTAVERMQKTGGVSFMSARMWLKDPYIFRNFENGIFEPSSPDERIRFYKLVLENAQKSGLPYNNGKQIELSQLMFAPRNPFFAELCRKGKN